MRPEYVVAIAEMLTTCIGVVAVVNCSIALYKDLRWRKNAETLPYFKDLVTTQRNEDSDQSGLETLLLIRDPFNQIVVLTFITPTIIHLTCHILMTFLHHYDYDMSQVELDTPSEEADILLNLGGSAAALVTSSLPTSRRDTLLLVNSATSDPTTMTTPANNEAVSGSKARRHSVFPHLSMPKDDHHHETTLSEIKTNNGTMKSGKSVSRINSRHVSLQTTKLDKSELRVKSKNVVKEGQGGLEEEDKEEGQEEGKEVTENCGENICFYSQPLPLDDLDNLPFFNPRMCKLLLLATILLESLTGFSAFGYQLDAAVRFENYTKTQVFAPNLTEKPSNIDLYIGALLLSSCHDENILNSNATLVQQQKELFVCQDFRSKIWSMAMCLLLGLSGVLTVVVIYWQFGETLAFRDSGNYVAYRQYQIRQLRLELRKRTSLVSQFSTTESVEEKLRMQYDQSADAADEKAFEPYTIGDT